MPDNFSINDLIRFPCPHCKKILKARARWAGRRGTCPRCNQPILFPPAGSGTAPDLQSRTVKQLHTLISEDDNITIDEADSDRLSMLLSLATCRDFQAAQKLLAD